MEIEVSIRKNKALLENGFLVGLAIFFGHPTFLVLVPR